MKDISLLVWLTQLGLSVAIPLCGFILLGVWLRSIGWGEWALWAGILLGLYSAVSGFISVLRTLLRVAGDKKEDAPVSFNDHQ